MSSTDIEFLNKVCIARDRLAELFLGQPDVRLIDIGLNPEAEDDSRQIGLRVHLLRDSAKVALDIPSEIDSIPVYLVIADYMIEDLNKVRIARDRLAEQFLGQPDVSLIDIGSDPEAEDDSRQIGVRVHLRQASAKEALDIPSEIDGIPIYLVIADYKLE